MNFLKYAVRQVARRVGCEICRFSESETGQLAKALRDRHVKLVFDIGANVGQFALGLRDAGYPGRIVSFEPTAAAFASLRHHAQRDGN